MEEETAPEQRLYSTFERHGEFVEKQNQLLALDLTQQPTREEELYEASLFRRISNILDEYQEQSYLLDPYLEQLVTPVISCIKAHALHVSKLKGEADRTDPARIERIAMLLYCFVKSRGYKTILRFFPHEVSDLALARACMGGIAQEPQQWALRYAGLLWLTLICVIPFDLSQFDEAAPDETANALEAIARPLLSKAGLEREGAVVFLARFYGRKDTRSRFAPFLAWAEASVSAVDDSFLITGMLQVLCEIVKSAPADLVQTHVPALLRIAEAVPKQDKLNSNTILRKFRTKLVGRIPLRMLPIASKRQARSLTGGVILAVNHAEIEVPEEVEIVLEQLFGNLQDKDTIVRWSAAKAVARIAERLPVDFSDQVLETVLGLFAIHSVAAASLYDLPAIAESTWHGACLACAEMARRGLVSTSALPTLMEWLSKALYFDLRKGSHSIGSNVRDAASYVLWALARAQDAVSLAPHAEKLARHLVTVALYDREIHIRRAASAAFQEHVGRTSLFPHGIDVLRKTDFYAVGIRRNAFLVAAPQVAEHAEYRGFLFHHLLNVTARHWDVTMRQLGAQSLRCICSSDLPVLGPEAVASIDRLLESPDNADLHGALLALAEIAQAYHDATNISGDGKQRGLRDIFARLGSVSDTVLMGPRNELITSAACTLIARSLTSTELGAGSASSVPHWRKLLDFGLKHRNVAVQEAASEALGVRSRLADCSSLIARLIREIKSASPIIQQNLGRILGAVDYDAFPAALPDALRCLLECIGAHSVNNKFAVEARRTCYAAVPQIVANIVPHMSERMSTETFNHLLDDMLHGLDDYTVDERGDVGSWIRLTCLRGLTSICETVFPHAATIGAFEEYFPSRKYHAIVAGVLKQGVERLDNVRQDAGECLVRLLGLSAPDVRSGQAWTPNSVVFLRELFISPPEMVSWSDGARFFPHAVRLLDISLYRPSVLAGLVLSLGSRTESTQRPASASLAQYCKGLPPTPVAQTSDELGYNLHGLTEDLLNHGKRHISANGILVPVLQTFNFLLEAGALTPLAGESQGQRMLQDLHSLAIRNIGRIKSIQRIQESMKIVVNLLSFPVVFERCVSSLPEFLAHLYPSIRAASSEYLYLVLQGTDIGHETDEVEEILLETEWSSPDYELSREAAERVRELFAH